MPTKKTLSSKGVAGGLFPRVLPFSRAAKKIHLRDWHDEIAAQTRGKPLSTGGAKRPILFNSS
jgi:hypothetical protein